MPWAAQWRMSIHCVRMHLGMCRMVGIMLVMVHSQVIVLGRSEGHGECWVVWARVLSLVRTLSYLPGGRREGVAG